MGIDERGFGFGEVKLEVRMLKPPENSEQQRGNNNQHDGTK